MKIYLVGGAVRDKLLSKAPQDFDYVVMESSEHELLGLGYQRVGMNFSIFLHPQSREEYALPRGVTLEEDLSKRDLTINAMAMDQSGNLVDPFNGKKDLADKVLRHTSDAFAEDPLRVFRVFRFKTLLPNFKIAPETLELMKKIVATPEFRCLSPERVLQELKLALTSETPSLFFEGLRSIGALDFYFKELHGLIDLPQTLHVLDRAARLTTDPLIRFAALVQDLGKEEEGVKMVHNLGERLLIQNDWIEAGVMVARYHSKVHRINEMKAEAIVDMFYGMDAFRKPKLVRILSLACKADGAISALEAIFERLRYVSFQDVGAAHKGKEIAEAIRLERIKRLKE